MPGLNQTGPLGWGPMTGRGRGFCRSGRPKGAEEMANNDGFGRGPGCGRRCRRGFGGAMRESIGKGWMRNRQIFPEDLSGRYADQT
ncbi:hypothetical protein D1AOALGA4SA_10225 [Olavius algarvensis Delta 1 endosymbiont]|nr:hypothetical protein D1AOALGA4SA_10225 [Olavius algarvensis Delta 1 endosymbiont]